MIMGNARFIGNVGFRQNEQTFDAARVDITAIENLTLTYAYANQVNRIFGDGDKTKGRFHGDIHAFQADWKVAPTFKINGYAILASINEAAAASTKTIGMRATGKFKASEDITLLGGLEYAVQSDYDINPADYSLDYMSIEGGAKFGNITAKVVYESLEGDGTRGFSTPLATLHKFQGFADVFLGTPSNGIEDIYGQVIVPLGDFGAVKGVKVVGWYHDFQEENGGADLGNEIDLAISAKLDPVTLAIKFADYSGVPGRASRTKMWFAVGYKF